MTALEGMALAEALRSSRWAYPLVNAAHILGVALLVGAVVPLDLRILGLWRSAALAPLWRVLTRSAAAGMLMAVIAGGLLFVTRATEYATSVLFICKMLIVAIGAVNALLLHMVAANQSSSMWMPERLPFRIRLASAVSLTAWLTALILGRLLGYF